MFSQYSSTVIFGSFLLLIHPFPSPNPTAFSFSSSQRSLHFFPPLQPILLLEAKLYFTLTILLFLRLDKWSYQAVFRYQFMWFTYSYLCYSYPFIKYKCLMIIFKDFHAYNPLLGFLCPCLCALLVLTVLNAYFWSHSQCYLLSRGSWALQKCCRDPCTALPCPACCPVQHLSSAMLAWSDYFFQNKEHKYICPTQCPWSHSFLAACPHTERFSGLEPPTWNVWAAGNG